VVAQRRLETGRAPVPGSDQYLLVGAQGERGGQVAGRLPAAPGGERGSVADGEDGERRVIGDRR
jgi:hypothetical protein